MMETWGVLEKAAATANFIIDPPPHHDDVVPEEETAGEGCAECAVVESDDPPRARADPERGGAPAPVGAAGGPVDAVVAHHRHREAGDDRSRPRSPLPGGDPADDDAAERGSAPTSSSDDFAPGEDVSSFAVPPHPGIAYHAPASDDARAGALLISVETGRDWELGGVPARGKKLGPPALDRGGYVDVVDDLESGGNATGYIAMAEDDVLAGSSDFAIRCIEQPSASNNIISPRSPAAMAMAFGSLVFLTHLIWVVSTKH